MKAGFIGLGTMGTHMAHNLSAQGLLGGVWNRTLEKAEAFAAAHRIPVVQSPEQLWTSCKVVILCVSADAQVLEMIETLAVPEARGKLVIDTSTVAPDTERDAAEILARVGARYLDAPMTGGTEGARNAKLSFMVGGEAADFTEAQPLFAVMGARALHMGDLGSGQETKAVNQVMAAGVAQAVTEGLAFARALKLPLNQVIEAVGSGAAGSWFVQNRGRTMVNGEYPPGFKVALHLKDLTICQRMAAELGGDLPCVDTTLAQYQTLVAEGHGDEDISSLYRLNRRLFPQ